jgi:hypothetical protein
MSPDLLGDPLTAGGFAEDTIRATVLRIASLPHTIMATMTQPTASRPYDRPRLRFRRRRRAWRATLAFAGSQCRSERMPLAAAATASADPGRLCGSCPGTADHALDRWVENC